MNQPRMSVEILRESTLDEVILAYLREAEAEDAAARAKPATTDTNDQTPNQGAR